MAARTHQGLGNSGKIIDDRGVVRWRNAQWQDVHHHGRNTRQWAAETAHVRNADNDLGTAREALAIGTDQCRQHIGPRDGGAFGQRSDGHQSAIGQIDFGMPIAVGSGCALGGHAHLFGQAFQRLAPVIYVLLLGRSFGFNKAK